MVRLGYTLKSSLPQFLCLAVCPRGPGKGQAGKGCPLSGGQKPCVVSLGPDQEDPGLWRGCSREGTVEMEDPSPTQILLVQHDGGT